MRLRFFIFDGCCDQTGSEAHDHSDENSDVVPATSQVTRRYLRPGIRRRAVQLAGLRSLQARGYLRMTEPSAPDVGGGGKLLTAAVQPPPPPSRSFLEFTNGAGYQARRSQRVTGPLHGQLETGNASKVVVIDAPYGR